MLSLQIDGQFSKSSPANPDTRDEWRVQSGDVTLCLFILPCFSPAWFAGMEERLGSRGHRGWLELFFCSSSELWVKRKRITGVFIPTWKEGEQRERIKLKKEYISQKIRPERKTLGVDGEMMLMISGSNSYKHSEIEIMLQALFQHSIQPSTSEVTD